MKSLPINLLTFGARLAAAALIVAATQLSVSDADAGADTWTQMADMPTARRNHAAHAVNGKIYAIGGIGLSPRVSLRTLQKVEEYDPATDTWTEKADMPTKRALFASAVVNGKIYVMGGADYYLLGVQSASVEEYDPATDTWTTKNDMPIVNSEHEASVVNGKIYVSGGRSGSTTDLSTIHPLVYEFDPIADTWTEKSSMPTARIHARHAVVDGKIYAIGGFWASSSAALFMEMYDPATDTWTERLEKAFMPRGSAVFSLAVVNGKVYTFGGIPGRNAPPPLITTNQYDPATDTWTARDDMPVRNVASAAAVVDGSVYITGGSSTAYPHHSSLATVWKYTPSSINPLWAGAVDLGEGWYWLDWFGNFNTSDDPWVYHQEHGYLNAFGTSTDSIVFWDNAMDAFWWTSDEVYPYVFRFSDGVWLWYDEGSGDPRWFYNYGTESWESS